MSETASFIERKKGWLLDRVIRLTAEATAVALYECLQRHNEELIPSPARPEPCTCRLDTCADATRTEETAHLLRIYDGLSQLLNHYESSAGLSKRRKRRRRPEVRLVMILMDRVLIRLKALNVTPMPFPERVDYRLHEPVHVVVTHARADDGRVVDVYIPGFVNGERVVRQARVSVLKYVPQVAAQPNKESV
jgi:hypothetical protein